MQNDKNDPLSKQERLQYIADRLRKRPELTTAQLAEELGVSDRTIYRDMDELEQDRKLVKRYSRSRKSYVLQEDAPTASLVFSSAEALALFAAASNPALAEDNFFAPGLRSALDKIGNALPPAAAREIETLESRVVVATDNPAAQSVERSLTAKALRALRSNRKLRVHYWSASSDTEKTLTLRPYDLRFQRRSWYLLAHSEEHGETRTFKVSRIRAAEVLPDRFRLPTGFSPEDYYARSWEMFGGEEEIEIRARFAPQVARLVEESRGRRFASMEKLPDGSLECVAVVNSLKEISWWLLSYGSAVEVLSPPALRAAFVRTAQEMAALYGAARNEARAVVSMVAEERPTYHATEEK